jgi:hypothetical protein
MDCVTAAMAFAFPTPDHMPCPDCGASLRVDDGNGHVCDEARLLDYRLIALQPEVDSFEGDLARWLDTPDGRFARWLAERDRP